MTYEFFVAGLEECDTPEKLGKFLESLTKTGETYLRKYCEKHNIRGWKAGKIDTLHVGVCKKLFPAKSDSVKTAEDTTKVAKEAQSTPEVEKAPETTDAVVEETKATETKEEKARGTYATSKVATIFEALDKITLPAGITVAKMRDGYVFKKAGRRVLECWKSGKTVRVCVAPATASMLNTSAAIEVTTRHDDWKSARYACEIERVAFAIKCYLEKC